MHRNGTANIAILHTDGSGFYEASEGDSLDLAPRWIPDSRRLVFQSAGAGRDRAGRVSGFAPFSIQELDLETGDMKCLLEDPKSDFLAPQVTADGSLYYIRRPHGADKSAMSPGRALLDAVLSPFRILHAIYQFINFFTVKYTGKPLSTSGGAAQRERDMKQMMIWGNLIDGAGVGEDPGADQATRSLVPSSWQLTRRTPAGVTEVIAKNVLSFDVATDGSLIYSNGNAIHRIAPGGGPAERLVASSMVAQVAAL
jgi:hypothetical protein